MNKLNLQKAMLAYVGVAVVCAALSTGAFAVTPPPDGGYAGANTAEGGNALFSLTTGTWNTAIGANSLKLDATGGFNTALGGNALLNNSSGTSNTALGVNALVHNTTGGFNTAVGQGALGTSTTASDNTAIGVQALFNNTTGGDNVAVGELALFHNTTGYDNTAIGSVALRFNTEGFNNTASGIQALHSNTLGNSNTANGSFALNSNTTGSDNTATGNDALIGNTTGEGNTATGVGALSENEGDDNTATGVFALFQNRGNSSTALGASAGSSVFTADNVICIGANVAGANVSNTCFIGNIRDVQTQNADAVPVLIDSAGQLGTLSSSRRFKHEIKSMDSASEAILALEPVTFRYKSDKTDTPQFGLIAEEVAKVNPALVVHDRNGEIYSVRYEAVNAMLLNEFLKEHQKVQQLESNDAEQQREIKALVATVKEQGAQIQKVSAQIETGKSTTKVAVSTQ